MQDHLSQRQGRVAAQLIALLLVLTLHSVSSLSAQTRQNQRWIFGKDAGLVFDGDWVNSLPVPLGTILQAEGCATISHRRTGELLFFTDGQRVFDSSFEVMPGSLGENGSGILKGMSSSTQAALIVPMPHDSNKYYIFTCDQEGGANFASTNRGIRYSIVDMEARDGKGDVIAANIGLIRPASEKLTAVRHANKRDFWLIGHAEQGNCFYLWLVNHIGVSTIPWIICAGEPHIQTVLGGMHAVGQLQPSADGRLLALACMSQNLQEVFRFNPAIPTIDRWLRLDTGRKAVKHPSEYCGAYGVEFSGDGKKLYFSDDCYSNGLGEVAQYDLSLWPDSTIRGSRKMLHKSLWNYGQLQRAPNGKIYLAIGDNFHLAEILKPNLRDSLCEFVLEGPPVGEGRSQVGLQNMLPDGARSLARPQFGMQLPDFTVQQHCASNCVTLSILNPLPNARYHWKYKGSGVKDTALIIDQVCVENGQPLEVRLMQLVGTEYDSVVKLIAVPHSVPAGGSFGAKLRVESDDSIAAGRTVRARLYAQMPSTLGLDTSGVSSVIFTLKSAHSTHTIKPVAQSRFEVSDGMIVTALSEDQGRYTIAMSDTGERLASSGIALGEFDISIEASAKDSIMLAIEDLQVFSRQHNYHVCFEEDGHPLSGSEGSLVFTKPADQLKIAAAATQRSITVYPNPFVEGTLQLSGIPSGAKSWSVSDALGRVVCSGFLGVSESRTARLAIGKLPAGSYWVTLMGEVEPVGTTQFVIQ